MTKDKEYVFPDKKKYPIYDETHARSSLAAASKYGGEEARKVREAVSNKYPNLTD